jgi:hypothetical protein
VWRGEEFKGFEGFKEFRSSGVQEFRSSGVQEFRSSGSPAPQIARKSGGCDPNVDQARLSAANS